VKSFSKWAKKEVRDEREPKNRKRLPKRRHSVQRRHSQNRKDQTHENESRTTVVDPMVGYLRGRGNAGHK